MTAETHLAELERKHRALDEEIAAELTHPSSDTLRLTDMKRRKLRLKEAISRLRDGHVLH